ncbi:MAG: hypothetical protein JO157_08470 [Acetobacteraceae bacterium]|nr:hypothetical protein [Acetobacteraceae bacterium]
MLGKARSAMTLCELEAAASWLERNRLADHLHVLDGDTRYAWQARQIRRGPGRPTGRDWRSTGAAAAGRTG